MDAQTHIYKTAANITDTNLKLSVANEPKVAVITANGNTELS